MGATTDNHNTTSLHLEEHGYKLVTLPSEMAKTHAIHSGLRAPEFVEKYDVFQSVSYLNRQQDASSENEDGQEVVVADIYLGTRVNGHKGIVHGGIAALLFDDVFGYAYYTAMNKEFGEMKMGFTANLNVNYRNPLEENTHVALRVYLTNIERRKVFFKARLESVDGSTLFSEATSLFIMVKTE
jgi:acyl-coenzyme A thioesterase PaaI-like protein